MKEYQLTATLANDLVTYGIQYFEDLHSKELSATPDGEVPSHRSRSRSSRNSYSRSRSDSRDKDSRQSRLNGRDKKRRPIWSDSREKERPRNRFDSREKERRRNRSDSREKERRWSRSDSRDKKNRRNRSDERRRNRSSSHSPSSSVTGLSIADQLFSELGSINKNYDKKKKKKEDDEARKVMSPYNARESKEKKKKKEESWKLRCAFFTILMEMQCHLLVTLCNSDWLGLVLRMFKSIKMPDHLLWEHCLRVSLTFNLLFAFLQCYYCYVTLYPLIYRNVT